MNKSAVAIAAIAVMGIAYQGLAQEAQNDVAPAPLPSAVAPEDMTAEMLAGADVFSIEGSDIGQVRDIVFASSGELEAAVISVGGFLGFGQHRVSIPLEDLVVIERVDAEGEMIVQVPLTKAQMKALPEYEMPAEAQAGDPMPVTE